MTNEDKKALAFKLFAVKNNVSDVARKIEQESGDRMPIRTVNAWHSKYLEELKNNPELAQQSAEIKNTYEQKQIEILERICTKFERLIERKVDELSAGKTVAAKATELTTAYGTVIDKMRVAKGMATENINGTVEVKRWEDL